METYIIIIQNSESYTLQVKDNDTILPSCYASSPATNGMGHTEIVPETVPSTQSPPDDKYEQKIAQCIRYIKLLSCALIVMVAVSIAIISVLSWHIIRPVPSRDQVVDRNGSNVDLAKSEIESSTYLEMAKILEKQRGMILSLQLDLDQVKQETNETFETYGKHFDGQESALNTYGEMLQNVSKTITTYINDVKKLSNDAKKRIEDIALLKAVSDNNSADINSLHAKAKKQEETLKVLETKFKEPPGIGSTFIRWGRPDCPRNDTNLVYSGYVGGGLYTKSGSAVNYLCLTKNPTWNHTSTNPSGAYLYGAEYEFRLIYSNTYFGQNLIDNEPPCAVCRSTRASVIMIPGTNVCTEGWTKEYAGYLVAGSDDLNAASEYICLDNSASTAEGSNVANQNGKLMYLVRAKCGSLKCPPYVQSREVTCVVCTR